MNSVKTSITALLVSIGLFFAVSGTAQEAQQPAAKAQENHAPAVNGIPGESISEGGSFATIKLDQYVSDEEDKPASIRWTVSGAKDLKVTISDRLIFWYGS